MESNVRIGTIATIMIAISLALLIFLMHSSFKEEKKIDEIDKKIDNLQTFQSEAFKVLCEDIYSIELNTRDLNKRVKIIEKKIDKLSEKQKVVTKVVVTPPKKVEEPKTEVKESTSTTSTVTNTKNVTNVRNEVRRNHYSKDRRFLDADEDCDCEEEEEEEEGECDC